jgi:hypothetical protein
MTDCCDLQTHRWHCRTHSLTWTHLHPYTWRRPNKWTPIFVLAQTVTPFISITIARKSCTFRTPCTTNCGNRKCHNVRHNDLLNLKKIQSIRCTTETSTCMDSGRLDQILVMLVALSTVSARRNRGRNCSYWACFSTTDSQIRTTAYSTHYIPLELNIKHV